MDTKEALRAEYGVLLDRLKSMLDARLTESQHPVVMAVGVSSATKIAVLLDHDLQLIAGGRHPDGDDALLMVAHRALLLYAARRDEAARKAALEARVEEVHAKMGAVRESLTKFMVADELVGASAVACPWCKIQAEEDKAATEGFKPRNKAPERVAAAAKSFSTIYGLSEEGLAKPRNKRKPSQARRKAKAKGKKR